MGRASKLQQILIYGLVGLLIAFMLANCSAPIGSAPQTDGNRSGQVTQSKPAPLPKPLPAIPELASNDLPNWIEQISPTGETDNLSQIRVRFVEPLVAVEELESPNRQAILDKFEVFPKIPGQFRFLTPRMVGFQADRALPQATRLRITLKSGLADLAEHKLDQDFAWTFTTAPIEISNLPGVVPGAAEKNRRESAPIGLKPTLEFTANAPLDLASLRKHLSLKSDADKAVGVRVIQAHNDSKSKSARQRFNNSDRPYNYHVTPKSNLKKATRYNLTIDPGLEPAGGNLATTETITSQVETYAPLAFDNLERIKDTGRFTDGIPQLNFNNGLKAESAAEHISISPEPREGVTKVVRAYDNESYATLNPWALEPQTNYSITIDTGLEDRYGQTLDKPVTVDYKPGDLAAEIWAPSGLNVFPTSQDIQLNLSAVNLPDKAYKTAFKVVQPTDLINRDSAYPRSDRAAILPDKSQWQSVALSGEKNQIQEIPIPLRDKLGGNSGMLAYGMTARTRSYESNGKQEWSEPDYYGLVQLTNLGVFSQWFPESGLVRVHHLSDGAAVAGATVEVYRSDLSSDNPSSNTTPCATGKTAADGTANFAAAALKTCMAGNSRFAEPPELLVVAREGQDWAHVRSQSWSGTYGYGVYAGWDSDKPQSRGTVFSDRFLYQPGETAWLTGTAYYLQNGELRQDKNKAYDVKLVSPEGEDIDLGSQTTNDFGTFSLEWAIGKNQPLGYYSVLAKSQDGVEISGDLRVAEFKPPNFQVDLNLEQDFAQAGQALEASVQSDYLFGTPVQGGAVNYYVTRRPADLSPKGWDDFTFGPKWFWPEEQPAVSTDVLETSETLDNGGQGNLAVNIAKDLPYPMSYRIDAEVVDASNLSVADSQTITALPGEAIIGLQTDFVADAGKAFATQVIATTPDGTALPGKSISLALERINYSSVTQVVEGSSTPKYQVEYESVAEQSVRSGKQAKTVNFTPEKAGSYRIRASFAGEGTASATDTRIWVSGDRPIYWGSRYRNNRLDVKLDKDNYLPGETATAFIQSPYESGELYFAVVRHDRLFEKIIPVAGGAPQVQFTVTPEMLPNAAVETVLVRQGEPLETLEPGNLENLVTMGFEPFSVDLSNQYIDLAITPTQPELKPAGEQTVKLALKDQQGKAISKGQFTVMVVDEAVLQLSGHRPPDLVETVYAEQDISTRFADNRPDVVLQTQSSPLEKGWGYGGGFSAGGESTRIRRNFLPMAYFNGSVLTDSKGEAEVSFNLPDNLTTWRVMAIATDGDLHFGNGEATFITTQPLITAPVLPQFARPGDRLLAGLSVTNTSDQKGKLTIDSSVSNGLRFEKGKGTEDKGASKQFKTKASDSTQAYRFPIQVAQDIGDEREAKLQFQTQLGSEADAFELPLAIVPLAVTEQVVDAGTTESPIDIPLNVSTDVAPNAGGLDVLLSSTVLTDIQAPVKQLEWSEDWPNLSTAASRLAIAASLQTLSQKYGSVLEDFDAKATATVALERLQNLQQPDGGFSSWPGFDQSDPFVTPYAATAIGAAKNAGLSIDGTLLSQVQTYLSDLLANPGQTDWCSDSTACKNQIRLESLNGLSALGIDRQDFLGDLYEQHNDFDNVGQIQLARHLSRFDNWKTEADSLSKELQATVYETARSATINLPGAWGWFHSPVASQAQVLELAIARSNNPTTLKRLTDGLLNLRRDGTWQTTYDNAQALSALVTYANQSPEPPNFTASVKLDGKQLANPAFKGYQQPTLALAIPMADLPQGKSKLTLDKSGEGLLHYLTSYRYRPAGNPPGRLQGLRITRSIHPASGNPNISEAAIAQQGLKSEKAPLKLNAGEVFDIGLEIITDHPVNHVVITDPLPAGFEAVDTSFQTSNPALSAPRDSWQIGYQQQGRDRILAYADQLPAGVYELHYLARSVTPGTYLWPGATAQLEHAPEEFGRTTAATLEIQE